MQPYLEPTPTGYGSIEAIVPVLQRDSKLVEIRSFGATGTEDAGYYVRRSTQLSRPEDAMERSIYIKGFPLSEGDATTEEEKNIEKAFEDALQIKLEAWIRNFPIHVKSLRMRRPNNAIVAGKPVKGLGRNKYKVSSRVHVDIDMANLMLCRDPSLSNLQALLMLLLSLPSIPSLLTRVLSFSSCPSASPLFNFHQNDC